MTAGAAAVAALVALALSLVRLFSGPTLYDRLLASNAAMIKIALICAAAAVLVESPAAADAAILVVLAMWVVNLAVLKMFRTRTFQAPMARREEV
jgi:multicomponent Na+:H+ antiporter subunit F